MAPPYILGEIFRTLGGKSVIAKKWLFGSLPAIVCVLVCSLGDAGEVTTHTYSYSYSSSSSVGSVGAALSILGNALGDFGSATSSGSCAPGYGLCRDGTCAPLGTVCCGDGKHAPAGSVCCNGGTYCHAGNVCISGGGCLSYTSSRVCHDRHHYCNPGYSCGAGNRCTSDAEEAERRANMAAAKARAEEENAEADHQRLLKEVAQENEKARQAAAPAAQQTNQGCSDITGLGPSSGSAPTNCSTQGPSPGTPPPPNVQVPINQPNQQKVAAASPPPPPRVVVLPPPQCTMCDVLRSVGELLPDLAEKLDNIKPETITDAEPLPFDGGPTTQPPFLPRDRLVPVVAEQDPPLDADDMKNIADEAQTLSDLADKNKESEDYAENCRNGFVDAAWKAFTAKDGSYGEKAKAARDSLKECWKAAAKHIEDTLANGGIDSDSFSGDK
jgi:hypothetical protein